MTGWENTRTVAELVAAKWVVPIMAALEHGPLRYAEIRHQLEPVSAKVLTDTLRRLEHVGLLFRVLIEGQPPAVGYELTPAAHSLREPMAELQAWYRVHAHELHLLEPQTIHQDTADPRRP